MWLICLRFEGFILFVWTVACAKFVEKKNDFELVKHKHKFGIDLRIADSTYCLESVDTILRSSVFYYWIVIKMTIIAVWRLAYLFLKGSDANQNPSRINIK